ncbi:MAG: PQQ-binding-like beta-propeller repeat protein, partial [Myxococcota bacterium]|nr:PQQ-binding-like beta-propeller repeat protein [Myxococcota bacterium]
MNRLIVFSWQPSIPLFFGVLVIAVAACSGHPGPVAESKAERSSTSAKKIDAQRVEDADATPEEWLTHGRTYREERFSPLDQIRAGNVSDLGLAWFADLPTRRGIETTPLMADGRLYVTAAWGHVLAYDARTGELLWHFDPKVPKA